MNIRRRGSDEPPDCATGWDGDRRADGGGNITPDEGNKQRNQPWEIWLPRLCHRSPLSPRSPSEPLKPQSLFLTLELGLEFRQLSRRHLPGFDRLGHAAEEPELEGLHPFGRLAAHQLLHPMPTHGLLADSP